MKVVRFLITKGKNHGQKGKISIKINPRLQLYKILYLFLHISFKFNRLTIGGTAMKARALTTSEAAAKLMEMGLQNFRHTRIEDNEITLPFGESKGNDIFYTVEIWDNADGRTWVSIYRFVRHWWEGKDLGANGKAIFKYANASAAQKKLFMELMEKEFGK